MKNYEQALLLATIAHHGQTRRNGDPYVTHPIRVAARVEERLAGRFTTEYISLVKTAAILHDVLEDTDTTEDELRATFGTAVAEAVHLVSRPDNLTYADWITVLASTGNRIAIWVKLADLEDNLSDLEPDHKLRKRYEPAHAKLVEALRAL